MISFRLPASVAYVTISVWSGIDVVNLEQS